MTCSKKRIEIVHRLADIRKKEGITTVQVTEKTGISRATLSNIEKGLSSPTLDTLVKLLDLYGYDLNLVKC